METLTPIEGHTYAISDLHGCLHVYNHIAAFLQPEDRVICLGDCGDRGPECYATLKAVYENPQFILLKGNHEDMLVNALMDYFDYPECPYDYAYWLLCSNGGKRTFQELLEANNKQEQKQWVKKLNELPDRLTYINRNGAEVILTHSGFQPRVGEIPRDVIWDRNHLNKHNWPKDKELANIILVHGHTPIECQLAEYTTGDVELEDGAFWYCDDHKVNIDCGTVWNDFTVLLDLDTWDEHIFIGPNYKGDFNGEVEN